MASDVAFLVYLPTVAKSSMRKRKKKAGFDWLTNTGAYLVIDVLKRNGIEVDFCSPESAHHYKVVLISMTSPFDVYNLIRAVGPWNTWRSPRDFRAVIGGAGVQNPVPLRHYVDYAVFGRAEDLVVDLVKALRAGKDFDHPSVAPLGEEIRPVTVAQPKQLYPHRLDVKPHWYAEREVGCPRKCFFCHYTFARRHLKAHKKSHLGSTPWASAPEVLFNRLLEDGDLKSKTTTAIDGLSERLRVAFNKPYTDQEIREIFREVSIKWEGKGAYFRIYQIGNFPTETDEERYQFEELIRSLEAPRKRLILEFHVTPFQPSVLTPSAYLPVNLDHSWRGKAGTYIVNTPKLIAKYSRFLESPYSHLLGVAAIRAAEDLDPFFETVCFSNQIDRLAGWERKIAAVRKSFNFDDVLRAYGTDEQLPAWFVSSYYHVRKIRAMARKLKAGLGIPEKEEAC
jgi:hypothetical protein